MAAGTGAYSTFVRAHSYGDFNVGNKEDNMLIHLIKMAAGTGAY
jgi:hypothetical protein